MVKLVEMWAFVRELRAGQAGSAPSAAASDFAARARKLGPRELVSEGERLLRAKEDVTQVIAQTLRGLVGDLEEHGSQAEFADDAAFIRKAAKAWAKKAGPAGSSNVLLEADLEETLVVELESSDLPPAELKAWKELRKAKRISAPLKKLAKKSWPPWFSEFLAAYISRELKQLAKAPRAESWQAKLSDAPALVAALAALGLPPIFGHRALGAAEALALRDAPTRGALDNLSSGET